MYKIIFMICLLQLSSSTIIRDRIDYCNGHWCENENAICGFGFGSERTVTCIEAADIGGNKTIVHNVYARHSIILWYIVEVYYLNGYDGWKACRRMKRFKWNNENSGRLLFAVSSNHRNHVIKFFGEDKSFKNTPKLSTTLKPTTSSYNVTPALVTHTTMKITEVIRPTTMKITEVIRPTKTPHRVTLSTKSIIKIIHTKRPAHRLDIYIVFAVILSLILVVGVVVYIYKHFKVRRRVGIEDLELHDIMLSEASV